MADSSEYHVNGLGAPVEILVDTWGVPHIYARSRHDVFVAQGFNAARERLFQIDLWRRRGLGLLSEVFGPAYVERDRAARLFLYRGDMRTEWLAYGSDTKAVTSAFVQGVNAFVALCRRDSTYLPPEFQHLGYLPSFWEPSDVSRIRSHGLVHNLEQEVARALTLRDFGPEVENLRRLREPARNVVVPEGLDLSVIPDDVLRVYRLATGPVDLSVADLRDPSGERTPEGSNNWVIGAARTKTGRPLLANDPHRAVTLPSLRYIAHLSAPGLDVIGAGEPALPGISIGHNGNIGFGLTIFAIDQEDLYVYETNPDAPLEYRYQGRWEPMTTVTETIPVKGRDPVTVELRFTRHGPVICEYATRNSAFAVRAAWLESGMAPYLGSTDYMRAQTTQDFVAAMNRWGAPGENQVYADPDGTIGWKPGGLVPIRPNWDGLLPVPGDGRYEWAGFHDADALPHIENPASGWVATANEMNLPEGHPSTEFVGFDWYPSYRHDRIAEVLSSRDDWTVQDCVTLQTDYASIPARTVLAILAELETTDPVVAEAVQLLRSWDGVEDAGSGAAALFEVWLRKHLRPALLRRVLRDHVPAEQVEVALMRILPHEELSGDPRVELGLLLDPDSRLGSDETRQIIVETFRTAMQELRQLLGPSVTDWSWGTLHAALLNHPARPLLPESCDSWTTMGPAPRGGSGDTVGSASYGADFRQTGGASFRLVIDVGAWDNSVAMNSPGQSGVPGSAHYGDLFQTWAGDGSFPLLYSRELIEKNQDERIVLLPEAP